MLISQTLKYTTSSNISSLLNCPVNVDYPFATQKANLSTKLCQLLFELLCSFFGLNWRHVFSSIIHTPPSRIFHPLDNLVETFRYSIQGFEWMKLFHRMESILSRTIKPWPRVENKKKKEGKNELSLCLLRFFFFPFFLFYANTRDFHGFYDNIC